MFFVWLCLFYSGYIPQVNKFISLKTHVSQGVSCTQSGSILQRWAKRLSPGISIPPCKLKGTEDDEIQFGEPLVLWKCYQLLPFAFIPPRESSVPGFTFNCSSDDFIIYQGLVGGLIGKRYRSKCSRVNSQVSLVYHQLIAPQSFYTPLNVPWQVARALWIIFMAIRHPITVPSKKRI